MLKPISELPEDAGQIIAHLNTTLFELHERRSDEIERVLKALRSELQTISTTLGEILEFLEKNEHRL